MISRRTLLTAAIAAAATGGLAACAKEDAPSTGSGSGKITLGFSQTGSESGWRAANTKSIQDSATAAGIVLKFSDAQAKEENQIAAVRSFIQQKVDVISFSPLKVTGWDTVLKEAKDAGIPVILTDRGVEADPSLFVSLLGSDFTAEGMRAGAMLKKLVEGTTGPINIAQLEGSTGSAPAIERTKGFADAIAGQPNLKIVATQTGDFTRAKGKEVMEAFLKSHPEINFLYAQNDDMALGAIQAIEAAGKKPGTDIKIITIDGVKDGFVAMAAGKINGIVECNPLLGTQLMELVKKVHAKETVEKRIVTKEADFLQAEAAAALPTRQY